MINYDSLSMPQILYPTETSIGCPILISSSALTELDALIAEQLPRLMEHQERLSRDRAEAEVKPKPDWTAEKLEDERRARQKTIAESGIYSRQQDITIDFKGGKRLMVSSFEEARLDPEIMQDVAVGFELRFEYTPVKLWMDAKSESETLLLHVVPEDDHYARSLHAAARNWMQGIAAPKWQQWWVHPAGRAAVFACWYIWIILAVVILLGSQQGGAKDYYRSEAHRLIEKGITSENQQKALETVLALLSEYTPPQQDFKIGNRSWFFLIGGFLTCLVLSIYPKVILGIGKGGERLLRWRRWMKFIFIIVPGFIASNFLWPVVADFVRNRLSK